MPNQSVDLVKLAVRAMLARGFLPDLSEEVRAELKRTVNTPPNDDGREDLRKLPWSSIDNDDSRDLDQVEVCEALSGGDIRVRVGIADVDHRVAQGTQVDRRAAHNTTSVYTGVRVFPMLPDALSEDATSLNPDEDRAAMVTEFVVSPWGKVSAGRVYKAWVKNHSKFDYETLSAWLEGTGPLPKGAQGFEEQLRLQDTAAQRLLDVRRERGALDLESREARPVRQDGEIVGLVVPAKGRARVVIEDFMVAANGVVADFMKAHKRASVARVVHTPERWPRIVQLADGLGATLPETPSPTALSEFLAAQRLRSPETYPELSLAVVKLLGRGEYVLEPPTGPQQRHFGLAVRGYSHSTAPNRRFADLLVQRLLKAAINDQPAPYAESDIAALAARCSFMEHNADKVERFMRKVLAAHLLRNRVGEEFSGVVTGASDKGTYVRLHNPPVEGRLVSGERGLDVGDRVRVRLQAAIPEKGFIDFARVKR
ncbi:MAG: RNB domain-containing ribonuclease [Myxococcaceae bacterium]